MTTNHQIVFKPNSNFYLGSSPIHGTGVFAQRTIQPGGKIEVGIDFDPIFHLVPYVTKNFGAWINHTNQPNSHLEYVDSKWYLVASTTIQRDQEITMNYQNTPWYIMPPDPTWN